jgi:hypothetical protein
MTNADLPAVITNTPTMLAQLTSALGIPREVLASDEEISYAWQNLPRELARIPKDRLNVLLARMCVAASTGLFDSAINYAWNSAILELREQVRGFGLQVVPQIINRPFDEDALVDLTDADLLQLCVNLNLITEDGYFFLNQCRDVRNNFSAAHPPMGTINDQEFIVFLSRCTKYALATTTNPKGVNVHTFIAALKSGRFTDAQCNEWIARLGETHEAQRETLFGTLQGIYCDPASSQETRLNAFAITRGLSDKLTPKIKANFVDQHSDYLAQGTTDRHIASQKFLEDLGLLGSLSEPERHKIISTACRQLMMVHNGMNNFYNEPPFAERLLELSKQGAIPESIQSGYVETVVTCAVGTQYGYSWAAEKFYFEMIRNFSPREISLMLSAPSERSVLATRIETSAICRERFKTMVKNLIAPESVTTSFKALYERWAK